MITHYSFIDRFIETAFNAKIQQNPSIKKSIYNTILILIDTSFSFLFKSYQNKRTLLAHQLTVKLAKGEKLKQEEKKIIEFIQPLIQQKKVANPQLHQEEINVQDELLEDDQFEFYISKTYGYLVLFSSLQEFQKFRLICETNQLQGDRDKDKGFGIHLDTSILIKELEEVPWKYPCLIKGSSLEILALSEKYPELGKFFVFGDRYRNVFAGYSNNTVIVSRLVNEQKEETIEVAINQLVEKAQSYYKERELIPKRMSLANSKLNLIFPENLIHSILGEKEFEGLIIGEVHSNLSPKKFIIDNIEAFKAEGVKTIFMEHLLYDTMQQDIDHYLQDPFASIPQTLEIYLDSCDEGFGIRNLQWGYKAVLQAAKKAKLNVVAIDTEVSYRAGTSFRDGVTGTSRLEAMNYQAYNIIQKEKGLGKFIVFVGEAHASKTKGIPGLSEMLDCPNIIVSDGPTPSLAFDVLNFKKDAGFEGIVHVHLVNRL